MYKQKYKKIYMFFNKDHLLKKKSLHPPNPSIYNTLFRQMPNAETLQLGSEKNRFKGLTNPIDKINNIHVEKIV